MIIPHEAASSSNASSGPSPTTAQSSPSTSSKARSRVCTNATGVSWANPFTLLSISMLFCVIMFILSIIDLNVLSILYPLSSGLTIIQHITVTVLYLKRGGILYFIGREAPGVFIRIPNLVALTSLTVMWGATAIFGAVLADCNNPDAFPSLQLDSPQPAVYTRLVICAILGFFEAAIMSFLVCQSVLQRRRAAELYKRRYDQNVEVPMSSV